MADAVLDDLVVDSTYLTARRVRVTTFIFPRLADSAVTRLYDFWDGRAATHVWNDVDEDAGPAPLCTLPWRSIPYGDQVTRGGLLEAHQAVVNQIMPPDPRPPTPR